MRIHIWQEALKEVEKGWLSGPYSEETLETMQSSLFPGDLDWFNLIRSGPLMI